MHVSMVEWYVCRVQTHPTNTWDLAAQSVLGNASRG